MKKDHNPLVRKDLQHPLGGSEIRFSSRMASVELGRERNFRNPSHRRGGRTDAATRTWSPSSLALELIQSAPRFPDRRKGCTEPLPDGPSHPPSPHRR